jgi:hypothetical protein
MRAGCDQLTRLPADGLADWRLRCLRCCSGFSDAAIDLIKQAGLPVRLAFKRPPVSTKGLFGSVAAPSSAATAGATSAMPSFSFGVKQASTSSATAAGGFRFGSSGTAPASSTSPFSFGLTKSEPEAAGKAAAAAAAATVKAAADGEGADVGAGEADADAKE